MRFTKMHGCGNDYIFVDAWSEPIDAVDLPVLARQISERHTGVGSDGLIIVGPSPQADAMMRVFNADGSEGEMCGNGIRCAAKLAWDHGHLNFNRTPRIATASGILRVDLRFTGTTCIGASVAMGRPRLTPSAVPVQHPGPGPLLELSVIGHRLICVGMGNPHAVCFVDDPDTFPVTELGPQIERHPSFPRRTNVHFVARLPDTAGVATLRQRTWERGSGLTQACGTGACAATVAAILDRRIAGREAVVRLDGGDLRISWPDDDAEVRMDGPAVTVCEGVWPGVPDFTSARHG